MSPYIPGTVAEQSDGAGEMESAGDIEGAGEADRDGDAEDLERSSGNSMSSSHGRLTPVAWAANMASCFFLIKNAFGILNCDL